MKYSPSTGNFYPADIEYSYLPNDLIQVSEEDYQIAMSRLPNQRFEVSPEGSVTLIDPTSEELAAAALANFMVSLDAALKAARDKALTYFMTNTPFPAEWIAYSQALVALKSATEPQPLPNPPQE